MGVSWMCCGGFADENYMGSYLGRVYLDVPFDKELPMYQTLEAYLEYPNGNMRLTRCNFMLCHCKQR